MNFSFSEEQLAIVDAAERVFADLCSDDAIKKLGETKNSVHVQLWQQLAETGMLGLVVGEQHEGLGLSLIELCLVLELQGKFVAPVPLVATLVECAMPIAACDNDVLKSDVLPGVVAGDTILSPVRASAGILNNRPLTAIKRDVCVMRGTSGVVPYAAAASGFVITATTEDREPILAYCPADADGVTVVEQRMTSGEPAGRVELVDCVLPDTNVLAVGEAAVAIQEEQYQNTCIALAALQVGVLWEGLRRTADYVSQRKQFGRPLGAFQSVSQQAANAYMEIESLRSVYWRALDDVEHNRDAKLSARVAKYWVGEAGHKAAHTILHLHGGIGQDVDFPVHRYFLWGKHIERYLGTPGQVALEVGDIIACDADRIVNASAVLA